MCDDYDSDAGQEIERGWVTARKEHHCYACRETIRKGDRYHVWAIKYDGVLDRARHCARCYALMEALWEAGANSVEWGLDCGETWEENFGDLPDEVARLAFLTADEAQALAPARKA